TFRPRAATTKIVEMTSAGSSPLSPGKESHLLDRLVGEREQLAHTASFAAFTGRALTIFRAGLALNTVGSFVNGLIPSRSLVAGFLITTNFAKPGKRKTPVFLSSLWPTVTMLSMTAFTSFLPSSV